MNITFLGGGNMASALIGGLLNQGFPAGQLTVIEISAEGRARLEEKFAVRCYDAAQADALAKQSVADYEGAILLGRIYDDPSYLQGVYERIDAQLASKPVLAN